MFNKKSKKAVDNPYKPAGREVLPANPQSSDMYVVEFPKSGITWLSFILSNILVDLNDLKINVTYYNIQQLVQDLHMSRNVGNSIFQYPGYRILKSHAPFNKKYLYAIYILRNPFNVMKSYYHNCTDKGAFSGTYESFVRDSKFGISAYIHHVESWLIRRKGPNRVHLIRYEDLLNQPEKVIDELVNNLGWQGVDKEMIERAVLRSNMENMQNSELTYRANDPVYKRIFVGRGKQSSKREAELYHSLDDYIYEKTKHICDLFYEDIKISDC